MKLPLVLGLGLFVTCWFIHLIVWKIHRPQAYPIWLLAIFFVMPLLGVLVLEVYPVPTLQVRSLELEWVTGVLLHIMLSGSYICGYAGIIEYSPSAEILLVVNKYMPEGISEEALTVDSLTEYSLTGKRIDHLVSSGIATLEGERYILTPMGKVIANLSKNYRIFLGVSQMGKG
jgi:hypothetical protein